MSDLETIRDDFKVMMDAEIARMKDERQRLLKSSIRKLMWLGILSLMAVAYTHYGIPFLECYFFEVCP